VAQFEINIAKIPIPEYNHNMKDTNLLAKRITDIATGQAPKPKQKNEHAVALGKLGGLKGGKNRFAKMSKSEKSELGKKAASVRWSKDKNA
jgi:hypothetical protein